MNTSAKLVRFDDNSMWVDLSDGCPFVQLYNNALQQSRQEIAQFGHFNIILSSGLV